MPEQTQIPRVLWAQQRETVLLTIAVPDIEKIDVKFEEDSVSFNGQPSANNAKNKDNYAIKIDLYEKIDCEACKYENIGQKFWRILLKKKDSTGAYWPRLTKIKHVYIGYKLISIIGKTKMKVMMKSPDLMVTFKICSPEVRKNHSMLFILL